MDCAFLLLRSSTITSPSSCILVVSWWWLTPQYSSATGSTLQSPPTIIYPSNFFFGSHPYHQFWLSSFLVNRAGLETNISVPHEKRTFYRNLAIWNAHKSAQDSPRTETGLTRTPRHPPGDNRIPLNPSSKSFSWVATTSEINYQRFWGLWIITSKLWSAKMKLTPGSAPKINVIFWNS